MTMNEQHCYEKKGLVLSYVVFRCMGEDKRLHGHGLRAPLNSRMAPLIAGRKEGVVVVVVL